MNRKAIFYGLGLVIAVTLAWLVLRPSVVPAREQKLVLRISHFRPGVPATVQKARGSLEKALAPHGVTVQWDEFKVTTESMLALSSGAIDVAVGGVEGSIAAIASGVPLKIVAAGPHQAPKTGWYTAILVRDESPIRALGDLKDKKIAVGKGGFSEAILALAVRKGGHRYPDEVQPVYLSSADAVGAFTAGAVDAILTLDPYVPSIQRDLHARILTDNEQLGYPTIWCVSVQEKFARQHPDVVDLVVQEFLKVGPWVAEHRGEAATSLASAVGFDATLWETTLERASYVLTPPDPATLPDLQYVAEQLLELGVIRTPVNVSEHVLQRAAKPR
ncbi:MAG TPA: aliphatic sulfonate ABC transporter substrate-binding protein [Polyangiaceae bacterium]|nr:aliphatic sulfonate ABC transporter substrate-binding protein [Polyangiaceae bacterium]